MRNWGSEWRREETPKWSRRISGFWETTWTINLHDALAPSSVLFWHRWGQWHMNLWFLTANHIISLFLSLSLWRVARQITQLHMKYVTGSCLGGTLWSLSTRECKPFVDWGGFIYLHMSWPLLLCPCHASSLSMGVMQMNLFLNGFWNVFNHLNYAARVRYVDV